jgi:hypothetical protein
MLEGHSECGVDQLHPVVQTECPDDLNIWGIVGSVLASFYGVQSSKNRKRDFESGKATHFIAAGIIMTAVCCFILYSVVSMVMWLAR